MERKPLGNAGLEVTVLGLGLAALGRPGYINLGHDSDLSGETSVAAMEANTFEVLDAAWAMGIRYFDAARSYGRAEDFLGSWLTSRQIAVESVTIGSKWGYIYTADWQIAADKHEVKEHSRVNLDRQITESRERLAPYLRLYQIHSATPESGVLRNQEVLARLAELRDQGLVIGLSLSGPKQSDTLRTAMEIQIGGRLLFGAVQATWNLLAQEAGPALGEAHEAGLGVIVKEALSNGRLTTRNQAPDFRWQMDLLVANADAYETSVDALALAAAMAQPWADCVLSGATTEDQLRSNVRATDVKWDDRLDILIGKLRESPETYWTTRSKLEWN